MQSLWLIDIMLSSFTSGSQCMKETATVQDPQAVDDKAVFEACIQGIQRVTLSQTPTEECLLTCAFQG